MGAATDGLKIPRDFAVAHLGQARGPRSVVTLALADWNVVITNTPRTLMGTGPLLLITLMI